MATSTSNSNLLAGFPHCRVDAARDVLAKSHRRLLRAAAKAGQEAPAAPTLTEVGDPYVISTCVECKCQERGFVGGRCMACRRGYFLSCQVVDLEIAAPRPALAGWEFLAVVEQLEGGNLIRRVPGASVEDGELERWRTGAHHCDHCQARRRRSEAFVVRADGSDAAVPAGTYRRVGRDCLVAFLGGKSAASIVVALGWPKLVRGAGGEDDEDGGGWGGGSSSRVHDPVSFLSWVAGVIREDGWVSKTTARESGRSATADTLALLDPASAASAASRARREQCEPTADEVTRAEAALAWARGLDPTSDYERNLSLVARQPGVSRKHAGILASALPAHTRALSAEAERAARAVVAAASEYVGAVGDKIEVRVTVEKVVETAGDFGAINVVTFRDDRGNALVWMTGAAAGKPGDDVTLCGTVKRHAEFRGERQTHLTRCKTLDAAQVAARDAAKTKTPKKRTREAEVPVATPKPPAST